MGIDELRAKFLQYVEVLKEHGEGAADFFDIKLESYDHVYVDHVTGVFLQYGIGTGKYVLYDKSRTYRIHTTWVIDKHGEVLVPHYNSPFAFMVNEKNLPIFYSISGELT